MEITKEGERELFSIFEQYSIKAVFYEETTKKGGAYHILYTDGMGDIQETVIIARHLE